ncbi:MAG: (d)CMP kinase [Clostridiales bacterium]|nr:(d)CMP kinase [Clostridiales bacterium]
MKRVYSIAIDGPAGAGKSTVAKGVAERLGIVYVDTGAMYRAIGLKTLRLGIPSDDEKAVEPILDSTSVTIEFKDGAQHIFLDGEDVTGLIRTQDVSNAASKVSAIPAVRYKLVELQRKLAEGTSLAMDGRDIGNYVLPNAEYKFFVTASPEQRASRRYRELKEKGRLNGMTFNELYLEMVERDRRDSGRECMPLKKAPDAVLVDTTYLTIEESIQAVLRYIV